MPSPVGKMVGTGRSCVQAGGVGWEGSNRKQGCSESPSRALAVVVEAQYLIEVSTQKRVGVTGRVKPDHLLSASIWQNLDGERAW